MANIFFEIGVMIVAATVLAYIIRLLKQPMILAYIIAGVLIGPAVVGLIDNSETIATLSEMGIAFLLFIVGLEIDFKRLRDTGVTAAIVGAGQVVVTLIVSYGAATLLGFGSVAALYIAIALTFSSTMIVVKLYADKRQLDTLHGRVVLGVLLVQDVIAIVILALLPNLTHPTASLVGLSLIKGAAIFVLAWISTKHILPIVFNYAAKSRELLFLAAVSWCFLFAGITYILGYSVAIGAFLAGISLASTSYNVEIISRVKSLRDFFSTIFFVSLGMMLVFEGAFALNHMLLLIAALSLLVIVGNPIIVIVLMSLLGHKKRTSFLTGLAIAQISEFSLIVVALGMALGHISTEVFALITAIAAVTITVTTYLIKYDNYLYGKFARYLDVFERLGVKKEHLEYGIMAKKYRVILCGYNRIGYSILRKLTEMEKSVLVVDFNPELIRRLIKERIPCLYGDIGDVELVERLNLKDVELLISTIPTIKDNILLIKKTKAANEKAVAIVTANQVEEALRLYEAGADYVVLPHFLGGEHVALLLDHFASDWRNLLVTRMRHIQELHHRRSLGHEHPAHH
jgi:Kef-type K+ transport system membrane component KefB